MSDLNRFGRRLRQMIHTRGMRQKDLARAIRVRDATISEWVSGRVFPQARQLIAISRTLDVSIDWLLTGREPSVEAHLVEVRNGLLRLAWRLTRDYSLPDLDLTKLAVEAAQEASEAIPPAERRDVADQ